MEWLHGQRERRLGKPRDSDRIAADLDLLTDGKLPEHELQFAARDIEAKLDREARPEFGGGRGSRGGFGGR